jgi:hypothetical protein
MQNPNTQFLTLSCCIIYFVLGDATPAKDFVGIQTTFPCTESDIPRYQAEFTALPPEIDGKPDEEVWLNARRSPAFRDLVHGTSTQFDTRAAVLWDDINLYVAFWVEEPEVKATLTQRDAQIWRDNDVELFIATNDGYYELEINAYTTIYEVLFLWEDVYEAHGYSNNPTFARNKPKVRQFNGVGFKHHPRGKRIGFWNWDYPGLQKAVHVNGTLNDASDRDEGWTVELALPWKGLEALRERRSLPPNNGDTWRMDFSRFNTYKDQPPSNDSGGWAWSPHGVWDSHIPECFTYVQFIKK